MIPTTSSRLLSTRSLMQRLAETHRPLSRDLNANFIPLRVFLGRIWWLVQMSSYLEPPDEVSESKLWIAVSCLRGDGIFTLLGQTHTWTLACAVAVVLCWVLLLILTLQITLGHTETKPIKSLFGQLSRALAGELIISCSNGLLGGLFAVRRLNTGWNSTVKVWIIYSMIPVYVAYAALIFLTVLFSLEFDYFVTRSHGCSGIIDDLTTVVTVQVVTLSYYVVAPKMYVVHLSAVLLLGGVAMYRTAVKLPHYSPLMNLMKVWSRGSLAAACLALLLCELFGSRLSGLLLALGLITSWVFILYMTFWTYEREKIDKACRELTHTAEVSTLELGLRPLLHLAYFSPDAEIRTQKGQEVLDVLSAFMHRHPSSSRSRILLLKHFVWRHVFEKGSGALVCLSQAIQCAENPMDSFLAIKYHQILMCSAKFEEILFLRFLEVIEEVKEKDEALCRMLCSLWTELALAQPNFGKIMKLGHTMRREFKHVIKKFNFIVRNFPGGFDIYDFYASFLRDVLNDPDKASAWKLKASVCMSDKKFSALKEDSQPVDFFDSSSGIILCDLRPDHFLSIIYMNQVASSVLAMDAKVALMCKLTGLIPPPYNVSHCKFIRNFIESTTRVEVDHPSFLPLVSSKGFLVFCVARMKITSFNGFSVILFAFRPMSSLKDGAILNDRLVVESHSENFAHIIGVSDTQAKGKFLPNMRESLTKYLRPNGTSLCFQIFRKLPYVAMFTVVTFSRQAVRFLLMFNSKTEYFRFKDSILRYLPEPEELLGSSFDVPRQLVATEDCPKALESNQKDLERDTRRTSFCVRNPFRKLSFMASKPRNSISESTLRTRFFASYKRLINRSYKEMIYISVYTAMLMISLNIAAVFIIKDQTNALSNDDSIGHLSARQIYTGQIAISARMSQQNLSEEVKRIFVENLLYFSDKLKEIEAWNNIESSPTKKFLGKKDVRVWEQIEREIRYKEVTLFDALLKLIEESHTVLADPYGSVPDTPIYYLFRNGLGETYRALEKAKTLLMSSQQQGIQDTIQVYYIYILVAFSALAASTVFVVIVACQMEKTARSLSSALLNHKITSYFTEKHRIAERLQERYDIDVEFSLDMACHDSREGVRIYSPLRRFLYFMLVLWIFAIGSYFYFYFEICFRLSKEMQTAPVVLTNDSKRLVNIIEADIWLNEDLLGNEGRERDVLVPMFTLVPGPQWQILPVLSNLKTANKVLLDEVLNGFEITQTHFAFLYERTNFTSPLFHLGYRVGNKAYLNDILFCLHSHVDECAELILPLYNASVELAKNSYFVAGHYKEDCRTIVEQTVWELTAFMTSFCVGIFLMLVVYFVAINRPVYRISRGLLKIVSMMSSQKSGSQSTAKETTIYLTSSYK